jgi:DNA-3-methyladenine glycosylase II
MSPCSASFYPVPELAVRGPFSLRAAAEFAFGPGEARSHQFDGAMRLAFAVDGGVGYAGAVLRQPEPDGAVEVELQLTDGADPDAALRQVARIVSLDHDGAEFMRVGERDERIAALQSRHPGQRPVLFHSPYEAAAWSIISARRQSAQAARLRLSIGERLGAPFELAGRTLVAFPQPDALRALPPDTHGLNVEKVRRLRGVAEAAIARELDPGRLRAVGADRAYEQVQRLDGIGPFYAGLVVLRAGGFADALLPINEPKLLGHVQRLYALDQPPSFERLAEIAERWRPFRTWSAVLIRLAGDRARHDTAAG